MNIEDAKQIPIELLAERLGAKLSHVRRGYERWYYSPFREERSPSFKVDTRTNMFKDFGHYRPMGDILDLYADYHQLNRRDGETVKQALKALEDLGSIPVKFVASKEIIVTYSDVYKILSRSDKIIDRQLKEELNRRKIPVKLAQEYVNQAFIQNTKSGYKFNAIAMDNDAGGVELSNYDPKKKEPRFKNCVGPKAIRTFPANADVEEVTAYAFSSMWDFLTWITLKGHDQKSEYIIYHGDSMSEACANHILEKPEIKRVRHFKHCDNSGELADANLALLLEGLEYGTMEGNYVGFKDLNEAFMKTRMATNPVNRNSNNSAAPSYKPGL